MELIRKGAEAELYKTEFEGQPSLMKKRVSKSYRNSEIDEVIRCRRTRSEAKLLGQARSIGIVTPKVFEVNLDDFYIMMEFKDAPRLKDALEKSNVESLARGIGEKIAKMHENNIIHGDLTTSNILLHNKDLVFIDYGLGFLSKKIEDKAVDLLVFKKTFEATHSDMPKGWDFIIDGYLKAGGEQDVVDRIEAIEKRARYH